MKRLLLIMLLILPAAIAGNYTLGSHQVSFNVSEPYNSSAKLDPPTYMHESDSWLYVLNMTADPRHGIFISILELSVADYSRIFPSNFAKDRAQLIEESGIGGYKFSTMDFRGYPAYQESFPAQTVLANKNFNQEFETHLLNYEIDERTVVTVFAMGDNVPYQEILDTIEVTEAPTKPTKYAPYV